MRLDVSTRRKFELSHKRRDCGVTGDEVSRVLCYFLLRLFHTVPALAPAHLVNPRPSLFLSLLSPPSVLPPERRFLPLRPRSLSSRPTITRNGPKMTFATLRALHAIIGAAIDDIERVYRPGNATKKPPAPTPSSPSHPAPPLPRLPSSLKPERPPRSPHRQTHLPSPPSCSPSPSSRSRSRSSSPSVSSQCSHTIDVSALPTPISAKFAVSPKHQSKQRVRSKTLPSSVRPSTLKPERKGKGFDDADLKRTEPEMLLDWPDLDTPFIKPPPAHNPLEKEDDASKPSLTPLKSKQEREEELMMDPNVINAVNRIVAASAQLAASVQRPFLTLCDACLGVSVFSPLFAWFSLLTTASVSSSFLFAVPRSFTYCRDP